MLPPDQGDGERRSAARRGVLRRRRRGARAVAPLRRAGPHHRPVVPAERAIDVDEEPDLPTPRRLLAARPIRPVPIGERRIGDGPVFVIAEAGVNHNGDPAMAHGSIDAAAAAGADAVKFQTFDPAALAAARRPDGRLPATRRRVRRRTSARCWPGSPCPPRRGPALQRHAHERGDRVPLDAVRRRLGRPARAPRRARVQGRVGRADQPPVPRPPRARGRPLLLSTGMADMVEVAAAVDTVARRRRPAARAVPLRLELPGGARRRQPPRHRDDATGVRRPGRLVRPHAGHRGRRRGGRRSAPRSSRST